MVVVERIVTVYGTPHFLCLGMKQQHQQQQQRPQHVSNEDELCARPMLLLQLPFGLWSPMAQQLGGKWNCLDQSQFQVMHQIISCLCFMFCLWFRRPA